MFHFLSVLLMLSRSNVLLNSYSIHMEFHLKGGFLHCSYRAYLLVSISSVNTLCTKGITEFLHY